MNKINLQVTPSELETLISALFEFTYNKLGNHDAVMHGLELRAKLLIIAQDSRTSDNPKTYYLD